MKQFLADLLQRQVSVDGWRWLQQTLQYAPADMNRLLGAYAAASRKLGRQALLLDDGEKQALKALNPLITLDQWGMDEAARALMLMSLSEIPAEDRADRTLKCYRLGDSREQQSWLRGLSLLPECERYLDAAINACRTNILPLFESIACENPYPCLYFLDLNFQQMVLKSLFNEIALLRIVGLETRFSPELSRMADDYVSEREAAGRTVPHDIWLAVAPRISSDRLPRVYRYLNHENGDHRYWAALSLGYRHNPESRSELEKRKRKENEPRILRALESSLRLCGEGP